MELYLNIAGLLVAVAMIGLWFRYAPREGFDRRTQLVCLALLILILFPVISVTDDLMAAQNPAETDSSARRDHLASSARSDAPLAFGAPALPAVEQPSSALRLMAPRALHTPIFNSPALAPIENRPPPTA